MDNSQTQHTPDEIDLHGLTVDEAIPLLDDFLYKAYRAGGHRVWVVHGKGSGMLRQEIRRHLAKHFLVRSYAEADSHRGGAGATLVDLA
jgi:DNA mismatch repair protein MutS2